MFAGALPACLTQLTRRRLLEQGDRVGGGVEGGIADRLTEGPGADDVGVNALPEQRGDDTTNSLQPVGGHQIPLHDPMPRQPRCTLILSWSLTK